MLKNLIKVEPDKAKIANAGRRQGVRLSSLVTQGFQENKSGVDIKKSQRLIVTDKSQREVNNLNNKRQSLAVEGNNFYF